VTRSLSVFVDADVLFAGAASPSEQGASLTVLGLGEARLVDAAASEQVVAEASRNIESKLPLVLPAFQLLVQRALRVVPDPLPGDVAPHEGLADPKDLPILVAASKSGCPYLVTFNLRHFQPGLPGIQVLRPGEFLHEVREHLIHLPRRR
jgi:hypothetical protein